MNNIKDITDELLKIGKITVPRESIERTVFTIFRYYISKDPDSEFMRNYLKENKKFTFSKSAKYYLDDLTKSDVNIIENNDDTVTLEVKINEI